MIQGSMVLKMKEMIYKSTRLEIPEILFEGRYKGYQFYILSQGTHPTTYIEIPKGHNLFEKHYDSIEIDVHGGLSYSSDCLLANENSWFIGWDYAHFGDYLGYEKIYPREYQTNEKRWTTEEIFEEVKNAIEQLQKEGK